MSDNLKKYIKKFTDRNLINKSLRNNKEKTHNNLTTLTDFLLLPMLPIITIIIFVQKLFDRKEK